MRPGYFDDLYAATDDPWGLTDRFYERRKLAVMLASLPRETFARAFEPGCASGLVTRELATRCDEVIAIDVAPRAVQLTRQRTEGCAGVTVIAGALPDELPRELVDARFDLVVISEVGYYCGDLDALSRSVTELLRPDAVAVACHWRHRAPDYPHTAEEVHTALGAGLHRLAHHVEADFLLDVWATVPGSVAQRAGIVS